mgnify:CR=1 FL=1
MRWDEARPHKRGGEAGGERRGGGDASANSRKRLKSNITDLTKQCALSPTQFEPVHS